MSLKHILSAGVGLAALGFVATSAQAAPMVGFAGAPIATDAGANAVEQVHWRHRHHYYYPYYYGYYYPYYYNYSYYPRYYYYPRHYYYRHHRRW
jgi:hypothetical protein